MKPIIIGIAGGTGSGKSTLAHRLAKMFEKDVQIICHDSYYKCLDHLSYDERTKVNYDHPDAFDTSLMISHIESLKNGNAIDMPVYSFVEHNRTKDTMHIEPTKVIIIEGILIFADKEIRETMDMKIFVDTDADIRFIRRLMRDVRDRGRSVESVVNQYTTTVKPMHEEFVEPCKKYADIIIPEGGYNEIAFEMLTDKINAILAQN